MLQNKMLTYVTKLFLSCTNGIRFTKILFCCFEFKSIQNILFFYVIHLGNTELRLTLKLMKYDTESCVLKETYDYAFVNVLFFSVK